MKGPLNCDVKYSVSAQFGRTLLTRKFNLTFGSLLEPTYPMMEKQYNLSGTSLEKYFLMHYNNPAWLTEEQVNY